ncbi:MAG: decaprenyl-phosphate phosphoribosyltransferase [Bacteroidia bacterium]|nr:decaprenyl-phosphate phosphoribosyltransferase [Bacteroidia bacterium]
MLSKPKSVYITLLRPKQWTKNIFVFAAVFFSFHLEAGLWLIAALVFGAFSMLSSSFYVINDILDRDEDAQHPIKKLRPIASGKVSVQIAWVIAIVLLITSLIGSFSLNFYVGIILLAYAFLQVGYNLWFKKVPLLDILAIASGFVLRAFAGSLATGIGLSNWFLLSIAMLSLFLAIEKRKAELALTYFGHSIARKTLQFYSKELLEKLETITITALLVAYMLWSSGPTLQGAPTSWLMLTLPIVLYGVFRYFMLSSSTGTLTAEKPEDILFADKPIFFTVLLWILTTVTILWAHHKQFI